MVHCYVFGMRLRYETGFVSFLLYLIALDSTRHTKVPEDKRFFVKACLAALEGPGHSYAAERFSNSRDGGSSLTNMFSFLKFPCITAKNWDHGKGLSL